MRRMRVMGGEKRLRRCWGRLRTRGVSELMKSDLLRMILINLDTLIIHFIICWTLSGKRYVDRTVYILKYFARRLDQINVSSFPSPHNAARHISCPTLGHHIYEDSLITLNKTQRFSKYTGSQCMMQLFSMHDQLYPWIPRMVPFSPPNRHPRFVINSTTRDYLKKL